MTRRIPLVIALLAMVLALAGCKAQRERASQMTSYTANESAADTAELFTVPQGQMAHVQVVEVRKSRLQRVLRFAGTVAYNAFTTTPVFPAVNGPVRQILAVPGEYVHAGQPLLTVNSPDYSEARANYFKARDAYQLADKNYQRAVDLLQHKAIAQRDLEQAESARAQAEADMQSSADVLRTLGISDPDKLGSAQASQIPVLAPVSGVIVDRQVGPGQLLQSGATQCFTITDTSSVWVLVNVYQDDLGSVKVGDSADITTDAYPEHFHGRISYIAPAMDPATRTVQERIVTDNPGGKLKKDMYVTATVYAGSYPNAVTVPDASVLRDSENQPFVYVEAGQNQFARRLVTLGDSRAGQTQITSGLREGDHVMSDGSIFLQFKNSLQH
ncbi:MAG TPA: efflux RND transporter periplasmic adaptor subunit [Bryobacteraceae bacterium]|nr:efflux RND transporter periplasmic adaptor subunit [Bryobacteraceae bacterium]